MNRMNYNKLRTKTKLNINLNINLIKYIKFFHVSNIMFKGKNTYNRSNKYTFSNYEKLTKTFKGILKII